MEKRTIEIQDEIALMALKELEERFPEIGADELVETAIVYDAAVWKFWEEEGHPPDPPQGGNETR